MHFRDWLRLLGRTTRQRQRPKQFADSFVPLLSVTRLEERRLLNAECAVVNMLVVDAGSNANDGQADTFQVDQDAERTRILVNGAEAHSFVQGQYDAVQINGSADDDVLIADLLAGVRLTFVGGQGNDAAQLNSSELADSINVEFRAAETQVDTNAPGGNAELSFHSVEAINDRRSAEHRTFAVHEKGSAVSIGAAEQTGSTRIALAGPSRVEFDFANPRDSLTVDTSQRAEDVTGEGPIAESRVTIHRLGDGFNADLNLLGFHDDSLMLASDIDLGSGRLQATTGSIEVVGELTTNSATINLEASRSLSLNASATIQNESGDVRLASPQLQIDGRITAFDGRVVLDSGQAGTTRLTGVIDVSQSGLAGQGGVVHVLGETVAVETGATIDASGHASGGTILIGGALAGADPLVQNARATTVATGVLLSANAIGVGSGGRIIVWANESTRFAGTATARGGSEGGDGGFIEISGHRSLTFTGWADAGASVGRAGTILFDPENIIINNAATGLAPDNALLPTINNVTAGITGTFMIDQVTLQGLAATSNIVLEATNDITLNDLTTDVLLLALTSAGSLTITADSDGDGSGAFVMSGNDDSLTTAGGSITISAAGVTLSDVSLGAVVGSLLTVDISGPGTLAGVYSGSGGLVKEGAGTLTVSADNTYTGTTTINAGRLDVTGSLAAGSSVSIAGGTLGGTGTVNGAVTMTGTGGTIAPGLSPGRLTVNNNVTLVAIGTLAIEINGTTAETEYDQLQITGAGRTVTLNGATLDVSLGAGLTPGDTFVIVDNVASTSTIVGQFNNAPNGGRVGTSALTIGYNVGADGNDIVLTLDASPLVAGTVGDDLFLVSLAGADLLVTRNGNISLQAPLAGLTSLIIEGGMGSDRLEVDHSGGFVDLDITFVGGENIGDNDVLSVIGDSTDDTAIYTPTVGVEGAGSVVVTDGAAGSMTIAFSELEPIEISDMATATLSSAGAVDLLTLSNVGPALLVAGQTNGVAIESVSFQNNANVVIDVDDVAGADVITIVAANVGTANLTINSGGTIVDNAGNDTTTDIVASQLTLTAATTIGVSTTNALNLSVDELNMIAGGNVFLTEANGLEIGTLDASSTSDLFLRLLAGSLTDANGNSNVIADDLTLEVVAAGAAIGTLANPINVNLGNSPTAGTLIALAQDGAGGIFVSETGNLRLALVDADIGNVALTSTAAIVDATMGESALIVGTAVSLSAATGIGGPIAGDDIDTTIASLTAVSTTGGIFIQESNSLVIDAPGVRSLGGGGPVSIDVLAGDLTTTANADITASSISLTLTANQTLMVNAATSIISSGDVTLIADKMTLASTGGDRIAAGAAGTLLLQARENGTALRLGSNAGADSDAMGGTLALDATDLGALDPDSGTIQFGTTAARGAATIDNLAATPVQSISAPLVFFVTSFTLAGDGDALRTDAGLTIDATSTVTDAPSDDTTTDLFATTLTINGATTIGGSVTNSLNLSVDTLIVTNGNGAAFLSEEAGLELGTINIGANNDLRLQVFSGNITDNNDDSNVVADDVILQVDGVNAAIGTTARPINVNLGSSDNSGTLTALAQNGGGGIFVSETGNLRLALVDAANGNVGLTSTAAIVDATLGESALIVGAAVSLSAVTGIGGPGAGADINTTITSLTATTTSTTIGNGIFIRETDGLVIDAPGVRTLGGNGPISIDVMAGDLTTNGVVSANGSGSVTLTAPGNVTIEANVSSSTGALLVTGAAVNQNANLMTGGTGNIGVTANGTSITMNDGVSATAGTGAINYSAVTDVLLGRLATSGTVSVTASTGKITDVTNLEGNNIEAGAVTLMAATGIGSGMGVLGEAEDIDIDATTLAATNTTSGNIQIREANSVGLLAINNLTRTVVIDAGSQMTDGNDAASNITAAIAILQAGTGIGATDAIETTIDNLQATTTSVTNGSGILVRETDGLVIDSPGVRTQGGNGPVRIDVLAGNLATNGVVSANGAGSVTLTAVGTIDVNANVTSGTGAIGVTGADITQDANLMTGGTGNINVTANVASIIMDDGTFASTVNGTIDYAASLNVALSRVSTGGAASVTATTGAITDNRAAAIEGNNIEAGDVTLSAATGIGSAGGDLNQAADININATTLAATNTTSGNLQIREADTVALRGVTNAARIVVIDAAGAITDDGSVSGVNVTAADAILRGGTGVGTIGAAIDTTIDRLEVFGGSGELFVRNTIALEIADISGVIEGAQATDNVGIATVAGDLTVSQIVVSTDESIDLAAAVDLLLNAIVTGDDDAAGSAGRDLLVNFAFTATKQAVGLTAGNNANLNAAVTARTDVMATAIQDITVAPTGPVLAGNNVTAKAGRNLMIGATVTAMTQSIDLEANENVRLMANITASGGAIRVAANATSAIGVAAQIDALGIDPGVALTSAGGAVTREIVAVEITASGPRFTALDGSLNASPIDIVNGGTATIRIFVAESAASATFQVDVDWRESIGIIEPRTIFTIPAVPETPAVTDDRVVSATVPSNAATNLFNHRYLGQPDGTNSGVIFVPVRITQIAGGTIDLEIAQTDLLSFVQDGGTLGRNLGQTFDFDQVNGADSQTGITTIVEVRATIIDIGLTIPPPAELPQAPPPTVIALPPAAPSVPVTQINIPAVVASTANSTGTAEERYYELRIVSFTTDGELVEVGDDQIRLDDPKLKSIHPFDPSKLPTLFKRLPADRYRIYLIEDNTERLVVEFVIERVGDEGRPIELPESIDDQSQESNRPDTPPLGQQLKPPSDEVTLAVPRLSFAERMAHAPIPSAAGILIGAVVVKGADQRRARIDRQVAAFGKRGRLSRLASCDISRLKVNPKKSR